MFKYLMGFKHTLDCDGLDIDQKLREIYFMGTYEHTILRVNLWYSRINCAISIHIITLLRLLKARVVQFIYYLMVIGDDCFHGYSWHMDLAREETKVSQKDVI